MLNTRHVIRSAAVNGTRRSIIAMGLLLTIAGAAEAGPPLLCHPFDAGNAKLLPWSKGQGWNTTDTSYDVHKLTADTLELLTPGTPVLARMETLRRATIYAAQDKQVAEQLLTAIVERTSANGGSSDPLAWFDAGYLIESYRQASYIYKWDMLSSAERAKWALRSEPKGPDGYTFVTKAIAMSGNNPEMEFAASLRKEGPTGAEHRRRALASARPGSLLAKNLGRNAE
jgi:hypothetical protein